ncbi:zinc finger CCCH domain-containing protein 13-like [Impatiens glandulifera]|uniref:zinc finger CCCH domain-containing protein 13-like n=1 Tax=Impatiens glandulifera TaxID=253017 RepID=UPI001FB09BCB|nr:zinc finger CCCH domain-containing protein 13-like [Impatiens glandulifera]
MMTGTDIALQRNNLPYLPAMPTLPHFTPEWNGFKAPEECALTRSSAPVETSHITKPDNSDGVQEYPERPGQPECVYFTKTGSCKFKSACRYHHPSTGTVTPVEVECVTTSENGLPLRPGKKVCRHYEQYGICKYGRACLFDHPVDLCFSVTT